MKLNRRHGIGLVAIGASASLLLSACGGSDDATEKPEGSSVAYDDGTTKVVNETTKKGGILKLGLTDDFDSIDPGNTYYAFSWVFNRSFLSRTLLTFDSKPGDAGKQLKPDLAEGLGQPSADLKTWTYKIKKGIKYSDGTEVKAKDIKYAVARSNYALDTLNKGPVYFAQYLINPNEYKGPYKDKNLDNFKGITTPDDYTVVFHLKDAFAEMDFLAQMPQTAPVPADKDKGVAYTKSIISTGPYKLDSYEPGKSVTLSKNPNWDAATDTVREQNVDGVQVTLGLNADTLDSQLLAGDLHNDLTGSGVQAQARQKILTDPKLKANADNPFATRTWYTAIGTNVPPLDNIDCRKAVLYAVDRTGLQAAYGGEVGGSIATSLLPPGIPGHQKFDLYPSADNKGDVAKAKEHLTKCGQPNGFSTTISYRAERPKEVAVVQSMEQALARVGIKLTLKGYPAGTYTSDVVGNTDFAKKNNLGLRVYGWSSDWPTGFGWLQQVFDPAAIKKVGNSAITEFDDPALRKLFLDVAKTADIKQREAMYGQIDKLLMENAVAVPNVWAKSLYYRPSTLGNIFYNEALDQYDMARIAINN